MAVQEPAWNYFQMVNHHFLAGWQRTGYVSATANLVPDGKSP